MVCPIVASREERVLNAIEIDPKKMLIFQLFHNLQKSINKSGGIVQAALLNRISEQSSQLGRLDDRRYNFLTEDERRDLIEISYSDFKTLHYATYEEIQGFLREYLQASNLNSGQQTKFEKFVRTLYFLPIDHMKALSKKNVFANRVILERISESGKRALTFYVCKEKSHIKVLLTQFLPRVEPSVNQEQGEPSVYGNSDDERKEGEKKI